MPRWMIYVQYSGEGFSKRAITVTAPSLEEAKKLALDEYKKHIIIVHDPVEVQG